jgi:peptidoglycan glycosyltransferase
MNAPLRRVAIAVFVLFGLLFANLNYVQVVKGDEYRNDTRNERVRISSYQNPRGLILVDSQPIAQSVATDGRYKYQRQYPAATANLYSHVTGYQSMIYGNTGIEAAEEPDLSGQSDKLFVRRITDMLTGRKSQGANVILTLDKEVQQATGDAMDGVKGAAISLNPKTGAILSLVSNPTFDPNPFASHSDGPQQTTMKALRADTDQPLLDRALNQTYPPGSTFKVIMSTALIEDKGLKADTVVAAPNQYKPPQTTKVIQNFEGESCGDGVSVTLLYALEKSCNTVFAKLGVEKVGADEIKKTAKAFGFGKTVSVPLTDAASQTGDIPDDPAVAQSSIGQRDVRMTPLQGAMIAAAVANNGELMTPYLVDKVEAADYTTLSTTQAKRYSTPMSSSTAGELQKMMKAVVDSGTGTKAQIDGVDVGGKTGTAEDGDERQDHDWFIGYSIVNGQAVAAVAVVLENAGKSSSSAAAIAGTIMKSIIAQKTTR